MARRDLRNRASPALAGLMKREVLPLTVTFSGSLPSGCRMYLPQGIPAYKKDRGGLRTFGYVALELVPLVGRGGGGENSCKARPQKKILLPL